MPHWLQAAGGVAVFLASWRWLYRPARRAWREAVTLLRAIRDSSSGVQALARELHVMAGGVTNLAIALVNDQVILRAQLQDHTHEELVRLVVDLEADIRRLQRFIATGSPDDH